MMLPTYFLVLLLSLPILIESSPQFSGGSRRQVCVHDSQCDQQFRCQFGSCLHICEFLGCGRGSSCETVNKRVTCSCPANTQGDPLVQCNPIKRCASDFNCVDNKLCVSGSCVNLCDFAQCGRGARCRVEQRQSVCFCPTNTEGNPSIECRNSQRTQGGCKDNSQCRTGKYCNQRRCVDDPCSRVRCATPCRVVQGQAQCDSPPESLVFDRDISQGVGGNTPGNSQGGSNSDSSQSGNQEGVSGGVNQGSVAQGANQNAAAKGGNQEGGLTAATKRCNDKSHCNDNEICEKGKCANPCDWIQCGQGATCKVVVDGAVARPKCICPAGTTGSPFVNCTPIQDNNRNNANLPPQGTEKPAAPVLGCKINSQCGANESCQSGRCVNPCALFECGEGAKCQLSQRQPQCVCPAGTEGDPHEGCKPITENAAIATQPPSSVTNQPSSTSGTSPDTSFPEGPNQTQSGKGTRLQGCETDPDPGECRGAFPRYYFNKEKDQCDCFLFGGCDIEGVRFTWPTFDECLNKCVPLNTTKGSGCKRVSVDEVKEFLEQQRRNRENNGS